MVSGTRAPNSWIHPSVDRGGTGAQRHPTVRHGRPGRVVGEGLAGSRSSDKSVGSMVAIQLASVVERSESVLASDVRAARTTLTASGNLTHLGPVIYSFLPALKTAAKDSLLPSWSPIETLLLLSRNWGSRRSTQGRLHAHRGDGRRRRTGGQSSLVLVRGMDQETAAAVVDHSFGRGGVPVRTLAGRAAALRDTFLPGTVVPSDGTRDADVTLDIRYHADDLELLGQLGSLNGPRPPKAGVPDENWYEEWATFAVNRYLAEASRQSRRLRPFRVSIPSGRTASGIGRCLVFRAQEKPP